VAADGVTVEQRSRADGSRFAQQVCPAQRGAALCSLAVRLILAEQPLSRAFGGKNARTVARALSALALFGQQMCKRGASGVFRCVCGAVVVVKRKRQQRDAERGACAARARRAPPQRCAREGTRRQESTQRRDPGGLCLSSALALS
jgi:hypothetical protein